MDFSIVYQSKEILMTEEKKNVSLTNVEQDSIERVVARLDGEIDDTNARIWGEEFAASGGKAPPPPGAPVN